MRRRGPRGVIRMALLFAGFLASLSLVVWRQSRALDVLSELDELGRERAVLEARRAKLVRTLDVLESRSRIAELAARRGMRLPGGDEIVLLPLDGRGPAKGPSRVAAARPDDGAGGLRVAERHEPPGGPDAGGREEEE